MARRNWPLRATAGTVLLSVCLWTATSTGQSTPEPPRASGYASDARGPSSPSLVVAAAQSQQAAGGASGKTSAGAATALEGHTQELTSLLQDLNVPALWRNNGWGVWAAMLLAVFLAVSAGKVCTVVLARLGARFQKRGWHGLAHAVMDPIGPANLAVLIFGVTAGLTGVEMSPALRGLLHKSALLCYSIAVFWYLYNLADLVDLAFRRLQGQKESLLERQLAPLVRKSLRSFLLVLAALFVADTVFDQDIGAWLAGLGIAGLAISLAAQDSLKNLFGSITILLDRPFQIGDQIVFGGSEGVIEEIGLRSTKMRTTAGHVVTIPNSKIVNDPVENISRRPYIRRAMTISLKGDLPRATLDKAVWLLRSLLAEPGLREPIHPLVHGVDFPPRVFLSQVTAANATIEVTYWYAPPLYWEYVAHAQKVNFRILESFEKAGIAFSFGHPSANAGGDATAKSEGPK